METPSLFRLVLPGRKVPLAQWVLLALRALKVSLARLVPLARKAPPDRMALVCKLWEPLLR
jgi:hypothetical protein